MRAEFESAGGGAPSCEEDVVVERDFWGGECRPSVVHCLLASGETPPQRRTSSAACVRLEALLSPVKTNCRALDLPPKRAAGIVTASQCASRERFWPPKERSARPTALPGDAARYRGGSGRERRHTRWGGSRSGVAAHRKPWMIAQAPARTAEAPARLAACRRCGRASLHTNSGGHAAARTGTDRHGQARTSRTRHTYPTKPRPKKFAKHHALYSGGGNDRWSGGWRWRESG